MIALCPNCRQRIRIDLREIVDRNLVRCSECWFVFVVAADELREIERLGRSGKADLSGVLGDELSQRFADWEKRSLADEQQPDLDDVSLSRPFDWTGFETAGENGEDTADDVGEGTILSGFREGGGEQGEPLCTLSVVDGPQAGLSVPVHRLPFVLGREGADCALGDPEVSRQHARIALAGSNGERRFIIEDLGSTNGTRVNGTRVEDTPLDNCDEIALGSTRLVFFAGRPVVLTPRPALNGAALSALMGAGPGPAGSESELGEGTQTRGAGNPFLPRRLPRQLRAQLEVVEGPDRGLTVEIPKGALVIGREQADLRLSDPQVSRKHALVEILARDQIYLKDLASKNGTVVNGILVKVARLQPGDSIELGDTRLRFQAEFYG